MSADEIETIKDDLANKKKVERILELLDAYDKADLISKVLDKNYNDSSNEMRNLIEDIKIRKKLKRFQNCLMN